MAEGENHDAAWRAFQQVRFRQPAARLVVVGEWAGRRALQAQWREAVFTGYRSGEDLATCYACGDMLLWPALREQFGGITSEASASGLAVVAFEQSLAGAPETPGPNAMPASRSDVADFSQRPTDLACDGGMRRQMGEQAREDAIEMGWDGLLPRIEDLYAATIATAHATPLQRVWAQPRRVR